VLKSVHAQASGIPPIHARTLDARQAGLVRWGACVYQRYGFRFRVCITCMNIEHTPSAHTILRRFLHPEHARMRVCACLNMLQD
jgi:hypothetical protein